MSSFILSTIQICSFPFCESLSVDTPVVMSAIPVTLDGASGTLQEAILRHDGDAIAVTTAFKNLPPADQQSLVAFLMTLRAPADAQPSQALLASNAVAANK